VQAPGKRLLVATSAAEEGEGGDAWEREGGVQEQKEKIKGWMCEEWEERSGMGLEMAVFIMSLSTHFQRVFDQLQGCTDPKGP
jgi:hypothetical protein